ncbi:MAG: efflux RND transporter periplasmic adaptor subunit [Massilia sp.]
MNRKIIGAIVVAAFIAVPLAVKFSGGKRPVEVEVAKVESRQILPSILASGNLVFRQEVQLSSEVIGKVVEVLVKEGDKIEQGQVLLRLNPSSYKASVAQQEAQRRNALVGIERARANLENQRRKLERSKRLVEAKFIDASKYDEEVHQMELAQVDLRANGESLQQAQAMLAQANEALAKTEVRAPISGTATSVQIKVGETAVASTTGIAGSNMMTIADVSSLMAEVNVDEADVAKVAPGQSARVFPAAFSDKPVSGKVESVSMTPKAGVQGRSYTVKIHLDSPNPALRTGMTCRVEIATSSGAARPVLPIPAILATEADSAKGVKAGNYVFAVVDGKARKKVVEVGLADDNNQEIVKGLALGDTVATGPARVLRALIDGAPVKVAVPAPAVKTASAAP